MFDETIDFIRSRFDSSGAVFLHEPRFIGREKEYLLDCIDSTFVSSVGKYVDRFESEIAAYTGAKYAVATVNGTAALHTALLVAGVLPGDEVITQPLTFVATVNAIKYCGAVPCFVDVDLATLGLSPEALRSYLDEHATRQSDGCRNKTTGQRIGAVVPMHTFGHPVRIAEIAKICRDYGIPLVEDAAESIGSYYKEKHTGTFGELGVFSFNGNKTITAGAGGAIVTDDEKLARKAKHLTTTAKVPHQWEYVHDCIGFNYRMPNLNAALLCAQLEGIDRVLSSKRALAKEYADYFEGIGMRFIKEPREALSNYWLNAVLLEDRTQRDAFLKETNDAGLMTRPIWQLMHRLSMYSRCCCSDLSHAEWLGDRIVNIPSSARL